MLYSPNLYWNGTTCESIFYAWVLITSVTTVTTVTIENHERKYKAKLTVADLPLIQWDRRNITYRRMYALIFFCFIQRKIPETEWEASGIMLRYYIYIKEGIGILILQTFWATIKETGKGGMGDTSSHKGILRSNGRNLFTQFSTYVARFFSWSLILRFS